MARLVKKSEADNVEGSKGGIGLWGFTIEEGRVCLQFKVVDRIDEHFAVQTFEWFGGGNATVEFIHKSDLLDREKTKLFQYNDVFLHVMESRQKRESVVFGDHE